MFEQLRNYSQVQLILKIKVVARRKFFFTSKPNTCPSPQNMGVPPTKHGSTLPPSLRPCTRPQRLQTNVLHTVATLKCAIQQKLKCMQLFPFSGLGRRFERVLRRRFESDSKAFLRCVTRICDVIVTRFSGKTRYSLCQKICGFHSKRHRAKTKHVGNKVSTWEMWVMIVNLRTYL